MLVAVLAFVCVACGSDADDVRVLVVVHVLVCVACCSDVSDFQMVVVVHVLFCDTCGNDVGVLCVLVVVLIIFHVSCDRARDYFEHRDSGQAGFFALPVRTAPVEMIVSAVPVGTGLALGGRVYIALGHRLWQ